VQIDLFDATQNLNTGATQDTVIHFSEILIERLTQQAPSLRQNQRSEERFAAPTRLTYLSSEAGVDAYKGTGIVRRVTELRASDSSRFPGEVTTGTR
jgi:hypothetical protein